MSGGSKLVCMSYIGLGTSLALLRGFLGYVLYASCACLPCPLLQSSVLLLETFASVHLFWGGGIPLLSSFGSPLILSRWFHVCGGAGAGSLSPRSLVLVVRLFIGTQNRLVALHSALVLGSRRGGHQSAQCNLSTYWVDKAVF